MGEPIPQEYTSAAQQQGRLETLDYTTSDYARKSGRSIDKHACVYVPFGYDSDDDETLYNVLVLMHGRARSVEFLFQWQDGMLKNLLDNMIAHGDIAPLIVVTPSYLEDDSADLTYTEEASILRPFAEELRHNLLVALGRHYHVHQLFAAEEEQAPDEANAAGEASAEADDTPAGEAAAEAGNALDGEAVAQIDDALSADSNVEDNIYDGATNDAATDGTPAAQGPAQDPVQDLARDHYAFGGFSFGAVTTWYVFLDCLDLFKWFVPMCGDCWVAGIYGSLTKSMQTTERLIRAVEHAGLTPDDFRLQVATGTYDPMHRSLDRLVRGMRARPQTFTPENLVYHVKQGGTHDYAEMAEYLYNILPLIFKEPDKSL